MKKEILKSGVPLQIENILYHLSSSNERSFKSVGLLSI
jgi:hypothetical protein